MTANRRRFPFALLPAALTLALAGCSGGGDDGLPREAVSGTVTLDGKPLPRGTIQFRPADAGAATAVGGGGVIEDGRFTIPRDTGLPPGNYKVAISASSEEATPAKGRVVRKAGIAKELLPARYNAKTELTAEVKAGGPALKFDLTSP